MSSWAPVLLLLLPLVYGQQSALTASEIESMCSDDSRFCTGQAARGACAGRSEKAEALQKYCKCSCDIALNHRLQTCCDTVGDPELRFCLPLCRYNTTVKEIATPLGFKCLSQLHVWVYCASDEQSALGCCQRKGVPAKCLDFCRGEVPTCDERRLLQYRICLKHIEAMMQCNRQGLKAKPQWDRAWKGECKA